LAILAIIWQFSKGLLNGQFEQKIKGNEKIMKVNIGNGKNNETTHIKGLIKGSKWSKGHQ
jgi:hypothetical protein